ncbi:phage tail protein, partial [Avibacterium paragallinarum]|uniref:phage tail protein n=1 Tax=Avibacterium paragallinarum TaxID=728 RepID=UPI0039C6B1C5
MAVNQINSPPTITKVGLKLATMNNNQHLSLTITHAAFGTEKYRPTGEETSLKQERLRVGIASAVRLDEKTIQMRFVVKAEQDEGFWCNEIGFWANNTLIAVYSSDEIKGEGLIFISDKVETTISFSLALEAMPVERIDVQIMQDQDKLIQLINQHENEDNPHPQYTPKTLTATSQNAVEETGHSHEIDKASTSQAGIVQLTNATDSEAETLGLTAKAGKTLKGLIDALTRSLSNYIPNSKKSNAINSPSGDTVATSKAVYDLNDIKLDRVGGEAFLKTIDYTKANDYTYSGFYRPNGAILNNLPLNGLMMLITHPNYSTKAHARGICFAYGSSMGNVAWDIFTTAFDVNGNHLGQKRIMTELGGTFAGNIAAPDITAKGLINIANNRWERVRATLPDGSYWQWEVDPNSATNPRFNFLYRTLDGTQRAASFPRLEKNEVVAYQSWVNDKIKSIIPVGAVVAFPNAVQNPHGFLRCDGSSFGQETYPALYQALGSNTLPDLRRSDVGMTAYFATDNIPAGWIAFDDIEEQVSEQAYPELYRYLVAKYGSLSAVPKAKDRFIRNAGALLAVGEVQKDTLQDHFHYIPT